MTTRANQVTAANAGERVQFRFAVDILWPGMAEFDRWPEKPTRYEA